MRYFWFLFVLVSIAAGEITVESPSFSHREAAQIQPQRSHASSVVRSAASPDSVKIYALLVEFQSDSSLSTTGTGLFGFRTDSLPLTLADEEELAWYRSDTVYRFDNLPHNGQYFHDQLTFVQNYFDRVSQGNLHVDFELFPSQERMSSEYPEAFQVPLQMMRYSPGEPRPGESDLEFSRRRTTSLLRFIRDAIVEADTTASPFSSLVMDDSGTLWEVTEQGDSTKTFILIFYAGSSYLTDGAGNPLASDSPSDMIHTFISRDFFEEYYSPENDTVFAGAVSEKDGVVGLSVQGQHEDIRISEVMMSPETSNQDSLNWGINGILVNQLARQLGAPTLNTAGFPAIGAFGIMDYAGYSAGKGFIPPYPSAFTRYFMGWDTPLLFDEGEERLAAVSASGTSSERMLKVPLNETEYYLIENRQRNLSTKDPFVYDTTDSEVHISSTVDNFYFDSLDLTTSTTGSNTIIDVDNFDIGLPGSGLLVWHVDEKIIQARLEDDRLNMDSSYRAVSLKEADGVMDIGVEFVNALGQRIDDYGGAEDFFPHYSSRTSRAIGSMGPFTAPSTRTNDGGQSFLDLSFTPVSPHGRERYYLRKGSDDGFDGYIVENFIDTFFTVTAEVGKTIPQFHRSRQKSLGARGAHEFLPGNFLVDTTGTEIFLLDTTGVYFLLTASNTVVTDSAHLHHFESVDGSQDSIFVSGVLPRSMPHMPSALDSTGILIPSEETLYLFTTGEYPFTLDSLALPLSATTAVSVSESSFWAVGGDAGVVLGYKDSLLTSFMPEGFEAPVAAVACIDLSQPLFAGIDTLGNIAVMDTGGVRAEYSVDSRDIHPGPFALAAADLGAEEGVVLVVTDRKNGLYITRLSSSHSSFSPDAYVTTDAQHFTDIYRGYAAPDNPSPPVFADIDGTGTPDILVGGTNGVYAFDLRGVLKRGWPAILDERFSSVRRSITTSPIVGAQGGSTRTLFSTGTGENVTTYITKIDSVRSYDFHGETQYALYFTTEDSRVDSSLGHRPGFVDTVLTQNDSLVPANFAPGGIIDFRDQRGERLDTVVTTNAGRQRTSIWPVSMGGAAQTSPLITRFTEDETKTDLVAVTESGTYVRWSMDTTYLNFTQASWRMVGNTPGRSFFTTASPASTEKEEELDGFYSYPNPRTIRRGEEASVRFRYDLGAFAEDVRLTIFTMDGMPVYRSEDLTGYAGSNEYLLADLSPFGSAVYRAILRVRFDSGTEVRSSWNMAIIRDGAE
ncbi:hypothetical protein [Chitinivibrio alkaliphilus]|uniref:Uncharacterized protein n=1 Tax=Chitinivibrio alkaliphilus ACht1 TaxID=1313304 RepID=U7DEB8_9BACT|nr:hypothetical protein [Chitinivibrio alkaliphilus]ERP39266.1 hypothetical protein CALK_0057 [Chitinivibrio alkaliphilus ACht1]